MRSLSIIAYYLFVKFSKIFEVISFLILGVLGNIIVNEFEFNIHWNPNWLLIIKSFFLFILSVKIYSFSNYLDRLTTNYIDSYEKGDNYTLENHIIKKISSNKDIKKIFILFSAIIFWTLFSISFIQYYISRSSIYLILTLVFGVIFASIYIFKKIKKEI